MHSDNPGILILLGLVSCLAGTTPAASQGGHGPVFGLATPTLPQGAWNLDLTLMSVESEDRGAATRGTVRYGLTPHVQLNVSVPVALSKTDSPPNTRVGTMMGGMSDVEGMVIWRLHTLYPGVGKRFETTVIGGALYPATGARRGLDAGPGFQVAAVTGYASRTIYAWAGAGYQRYFDASGDRLGELAFLSAVTAWRPPVFQGDYPKPDWRIFIESVIEFGGRDRSAGAEITGSGGEKAFVGPSFLGLYRALGLGVGALIPAYQDVNGDQPEEGIRLTMNLSYWF